jgi:hypothetical protein
MIDRRMTGLSRRNFILGAAVAAPRSCWRKA